MNYFSFFQQDVDFFVDKSFIRKKYLELLKSFHAEQNEEQLTYLHQAYKTLMDDEHRLEYYLKIKGIIDEEEKQQPKLSQNFLMEMMDINEAIQEGNQNAKQQAINHLEKNFQEIIAFLHEDMTPENQSLLAQRFYERKYLKRIVNQ